jgi:NDP-sugar pyrophosphorylase family protein
MPKALVPLAGKTLLQWQIDRLRAVGISDIVVNVHHLPDMIIDAVRQNQGWGCRVQISDERDALLETGGGLRKARTLLEGDEPILVCNVDILSNIDLQALMTAYENLSSLQGRAGERLLGLLVVSPRETQRYLLFDQDNRLRGWTNKATGEVKPSCLSPLADSLTPLAFSGMQILSPRIFDRMDRVVADKGERFSLIDLYLSICGEEVLKAYVPADYRMMDVGKIDQIDEAERFAQALE